MKKQMIIALLVSLLLNKNAQAMEQNAQEFAFKTSILSLLKSNNVLLIVPRTTLFNQWAPGLDAVGQVAINRARREGIPNKIARNIVIDALVDYILYLRFKVSAADAKYAEHKEICKIVYGESIRNVANLLFP